MVCLRGGGGGGGGGGGWTMEGVASWKGEIRRQLEKKNWISATLTEKRSPWRIRTVEDPHSKKS